MKQLGRSSFTKVIVVITSFLLLGPSFNVGSTLAFVDDGFYEDDRPESGYQGVLFRDQPPWDSTFSWLELGGKTCEDINGNCLAYVSATGAVPFSTFNSLLGPCRTPEETDCIEQLQASVVGGQFEAGQFTRAFPAVGANDFRGDARMRLPSGGTAGVWNFPSIRHVGGSDFFLRVGVSGTMAGGPSLSEIGVEAKTSAIHVALFAVQEISGNCSEDGIKYFCGPRKKTFTETQEGSPLYGVNISPWSGLGWPVPTDCVMTSRDGRCLQRRALPTNLAVRVTLKLSQSPSGWLHGRIAEPDVELTKLTGKNGYKLVLGGRSISVPVLKSGGRFNDLPSSIQDAYRASGRFRSSPSFTRDFYCTDCADPMKRNSTSTPLAYGRDSFDELALWLPHVDDRASGDLSIWSIRTIPASDVSQMASLCFALDGTLKGLVATNATVYSPGPPELDMDEGTLNYRVAAPHLTSGSQKFLGTYDLVMRSDTARCIYGIKNVPVNASISVLQGDESTTVATKIVSERNGWIQLAAYGFGFSAPTIKIKLTAQSEVVKGPHGNVPRTAGPRKIITTKCRKGPQLRVLTGIQIKCPLGWKIVKP